MMMSTHRLRSQSKTTQPFVSSCTNMSIDAINAPSTLCNVLQGLSDAQNSDIRDMGFESIKSFAIEKIPTRLGSWLLANYDHNRNVLKAGDGVINITPLKVYDVFGVPMGRYTVYETPKARKGSLREEWKKQFTGCSKICIKHVIERLESDREGGRLFKLNFLVVFNSIMAESTKSGTVNQKCLSSIINEGDIRNMDWCGYIITCLKRTKEEWNGEEAYNGPLTCLAVLYAHEQRLKRHRDYTITPAIEYVSNEHLEQLEKQVLPDEGDQVVDLPIDVVGGGNDDVVVGGVKQEECELDETSYLEMSSSDQGEMVRIKRYKVHRSIAPTLEYIFNEHGDIAAECKFTQPTLKAIFLESVCKVFRQIQTKNIGIEDLSKAKAALSDAKEAKIDVAWLEAHLEALTEAIRKKKEANKQYCLSLETKVGIMRAKNSFQIDARKGRAELVALQEQIKEAERNAEAMRLVGKYLDETCLAYECDPCLFV